MKNQGQPLELGMLDGKDISDTERAIATIANKWNVRF